MKFPWRRVLTSRTVLLCVALLGPSAARAQRIGPLSSTQGDALKQSESKLYTYTGTGTVVWESNAKIVPDDLNVKLTVPTRPGLYFLRAVNKTNPGASDIRFISVAPNSDYNKYFYAREGCDPAKMLGYQYCFMPFTNSPFTDSQFNGARILGWLSDSTVFLTGQEPKSGDWLVEMYKNGKWSEIARSATDFSNLNDDSHALNYAYVSQAGKPSVYYRQNGNVYQFEGAKPVRLTDTTSFSDFNTFVAMDSLTVLDDGTLFHVGDGSAVYRHPDGTSVTVDFMQTCSKPQPESQVSASSLIVKNAVLLVCKFNTPGSSDSTVDIYNLTSRKVPRIVSNALNIADKFTDHASKQAVFLGEDGKIYYADDLPPEIMGSTGHDLGNPQLFVGKTKDNLFYGYYSDQPLLTDGKNKVLPLFYNYAVPGNQPAEYRPGGHPVIPYAFVGTNILVSLGGRYGGGQFGFLIPVK